VDIIQKIVRWADSEGAIKVLILQGSRATKTPADELADYDVSVFCSTSAPYTETEEWLTRIGPVWVCVKEKVSLGGQVFPTRLVIFEGGVKVDFSFFSLDGLDRMVKGHLPDEYNRGYQILLDKDNLTQSFPKPNYKEPRAQKPSKREFLETIEEFWFEAYHVGIYLKREDLWSVKFRSAAMHVFLLRMIEWGAQADNGWQQTVPPIGKRMASWVQPSVWQELQGGFAHFDAADSWDALFHILVLFRRLSVDLSHQLGFDYPEATDKNISGFILKLREGR
jgi:aminoglycoside 6-adenylyltransferase